MPRMLLTPSIMAKEATVLAIQHGLPAGTYRAWYPADESWLVLSLDDASSLLWPRLKQQGPTYDESKRPWFDDKFRNIVMKSWVGYGKKDGFHIRIDVLDGASLGCA